MNLARNKIVRRHKLIAQSFRGYQYMAIVSSSDIILDHYIDIAHPGPSSSPLLQSTAEQNWSYFGKDHGPRTSLEFKLKDQGRMAPMDLEKLSSLAKLRRT